MRILKKCLCLMLTLMMLLALSACKSDADGTEAGPGNVPVDETWEIDFSGKDYGGTRLLC